jgi:outer membrane receptor protein involved in Fe transport
MRGEFPFEYQHGLVDVVGMRYNNLSREAQGRVGGAVVLDAFNKLQFSVQYLAAFRQLPGAIVFYHPINFQTLENKQLNGSLKHDFKKNQFKLIHFANFSHTTTDYRDSFHIVRPQWQQYTENNFDFGENGQFNMGKMRLNWSGQYVFTSLTTNRADIYLPSRQRFVLNAGTEFQHNKIKIRFDLPIQYLIDKYQFTQSEPRFLFTPSVGLNQALFGKKSKSVFRISIGQFARVATFSEMYYGQIGNPTLRPERSQMVNSGFHNKRRFGKVEINLGFDAFYGRIQDKIVAIPTQNLFIWSVRNLQIIESYGFDEIISIDYFIKSSDLVFNIAQKSSLNVAHDISDSNGPTYKQQIPYTPYWLHACEITVKRKQLSVSYRYSYNDFRFVLGENIAANVLNAFDLHDLRINYEKKFKVESNHGIRLHLKINNMLNEQYQVMRGFPMPGRNFEFGLTWFL